ncbi:hypothetical protein G7Y89_g12717 [Cudoniella acicularis]|uniref:Uncharacterized protein n=1 Tax=Cudoniella acicularis TaxID=354080 RepID=A0A8H4R9J6_9HELO|nr:hypothetical protein G7Y89_g12717 [Cudoniella acicularis]
MQILSARCTNSGPDAMETVSYGEINLRAKVIPLSVFRGDVMLRDGTRRIYDQLEYYDPSIGKQVCLGSYHPGSVIQVDGFTHPAGTNHFLDNPDVQGADLQCVTDGPYYGVLMAKTYIMVIKPLAEGGSDILERVGSISRSGLGGPTSDKSRFFERVEPRIIKLV